MKSLRHFAVALLALNLAACGGGDDGGSSNGAGSAAVTAQNSSSSDLAKFAGTYSGTITATVNVDGKSETLSQEITFEISSDGKTIAVAEEVFPLTSNTFTIKVSLPLSSGNTTCTFIDATFNGTISENAISGNINGDTTCVVDGSPVPGKLSGYSGATRI